MAGLVHMLEEILLVFFAGLLVGQLLSRRKIKPKLSAYSTMSAAVLVFVMGTSIGLARGTLIEILPLAGTISVVLGVATATASVAVSHFFRGSERS